MKLMIASDIHGSAYWCKKMLEAFEQNGAERLILLGDILYHGHKYNCTNLPPLSKGDILLHGHTHVPVIKDCGDYTYINPGSVSIPKENSTHSYLILENGKFSFGELI